MKRSRLRPLYALAVTVLLGVGSGVAPAAASTRANPLCIGPVQILAVKVLDKICLPTSL